MKHIIIPILHKAGVGGGGRAGKTQRDEFAHKTAKITESNSPVS